MDACIGGGEMVASHIQSYHFLKSQKYSSLTNIKYCVAIYICVRSITQATFSWVQTRAVQEVISLRRLKPMCNTAVK